MNQLRGCVVSLVTVIGSTLASAASGQTAVNVPAATQWFDTGVDIPAGRSFKLVASGHWTNGGTNPQQTGPEGFPSVHLASTLDRRSPLAALVGRIGHRPFLVGPSYEGQSAARGRLYLSMNDTPGGFADNQGSLDVTVTVQPPLGSIAGSTKLGSVSFMPASQLVGLATLALGGGRLQLSQTTDGIPLPGPGGSQVMSYVTFGPYLQGQGVRDFVIDLPITEYSPEQIQNTGGVTILAQYVATHGFVFVDRVRFLVNNIHSSFDTDLAVRLGPDEILLDLQLHAPGPAVRGEGNGYTGVLVIPIPLGWEDGLCPDLNASDMKATLHLAPEIDAAGQLHLKDPTVELRGDISLSVGDDLVKDFKATIMKKFQDLLAKELASDAVKKPLEKTLTQLLLGNKPNAGISEIKIDENGLEVSFAQ
jgi:hypothetical protein